MSKVQELILKLKEDWSFLRKTSYDNNSFELLCVINNKGIKEDLENSVIALGISNVPIQYLSFITETDGAKLFYDETYGQAGLYLYEVDVIKSKNLEWRKSYINQDLLSTDLIIGEFFGDSDLVILRCDENSNDYGDIIISLPLDERKDWYFLTDDFENFLIKFSRNEGLKYWEYSRTH